MSEKITKFGNISIEQLAEAQKVIGDVLLFIAENLDATDKETKDLIRCGFALLAPEEMMQRPLRICIAKKLRDSLDKESVQEKKTPMATFSAPSIKS